MLSTFNSFFISSVSTSSYGLLYPSPGLVVYAGDRNAYIDSFKRYPLMIIDDLGVERNSEFAREQVFSVIDSRYRSELPMIVTTNLTLEELQHPEDLSRSRIYDRILERCLPIRVNDQNIRELNQAATFAQAKQLLRSS